MADVQLIHQRDTLLYPNVLFNRPIAGLSRLQIALFGGKEGHLAGLSQMYASLIAIGLGPTCVVENKLSIEAPLPVGSMLLTVDKKHKNQIGETADVLEFMQNANIAVLAPNIELSSAMQLLFERVFTQTSTPLVITDELVPLYSFLAQTSHKRPQTLLLLSPDGLVKLAKILKLEVVSHPGRGIYNTITLADAVSEVCGAHVVCIDDDTVVIRDTSDVSRRGIIHLAAEVANHQGLLTALITGLLVDSSQSFVQVLEKVMTAGYLYNKVLAELVAVKEPSKQDQMIVSVLQKELT